MPGKPSELIEQIIDHAKQHGEESEPDMEVGDLQEALRACWELLSPDQHTAVYAAIEEALWL